DPPRGFATHQRLRERTVDGLSPGRAGCPPDPRAIWNDDRVPRVDTMAGILMSRARQVSGQGARRASNGAHKSTIEGAGKRTAKDIADQPRVAFQKQAGSTAEGRSRRGHLQERGHA